MATTEDIAKLLIQVTGTQDLDKLADALRRQGAAAQKAQADIYDFADVYELVERESPQVKQALDSVDFAMEEIARAAEKAAASTAKVVTSAGGTATKGFGNLQQGITAASYAFQDFTATSGDLGAKLNSISNNLPQLLVGLGGLGQALAVGATAGIAIYRNWDSIAALWESRNPFPDATMSADFLKKSLDNTSKAIDTLRDKTGLTLDQTVEYNKLLKDQAGLQAEVAQAEETAANKRALGAESNERAQEQAQAVRKVVAESGGYEKVVEYLTQSEAKAFGFDDPKVIASVRSGWENAVNEALKGSRAAIDSIRTAVGADKTGLLGGVSTQMELYDPEKVRTREKAEKERRADLDRRAEETQRTIEGLNKRRDDQVKADEDARKAREAQAKATDADVEKRRKEADKILEDAQKAEAKRIVGSVGKEYQGRAEIALAENRQAEALGAPVARSAAQEAGFRRQNIPYALPEQELAGRMQQQMAQSFERRGAAPEAAQQAASDIAGKASLDVARRSEQISATGADTIQQTLELTRQIIASYAHQNAALNAAQQEVARQRAALARMRPQQRPAAGEGGFGH